MQTRTKKTLAVGALGLAFAAAGVGSASAAAPVVLGGFGPATNLVPGAAAQSTAGAQNALTSGTSALRGNRLLPSGNHLDGNQVAPVSGLLGGLPLGG
ncbi:ATP-binding protein [Streptomyces sp. NBC_00433]